VAEHVDARVVSRDTERRRRDAVSIARREKMSTPERNQNKSSTVVSTPLFFSRGVGFPPTERVALVAPGR